MTDGEATTSATGLPRNLRANEGSRIHLRCLGEWKDVTVVASASAKHATTALPACPRYLYAEDVAKLRGISVRQARRWLEELHEVHGHEVVGETRARRGVRRFTTEAALARITPRARRDDDRIHEVLEEILQRLTVVEQTVAAMPGHYSRR